MGKFWSASSAVNEANLNRGATPLFDASVGSTAEYASINAAVAAGKYNLAILPGATITADLTISTLCKLVGIGYAIQLVGNYTLTLSADDCFVTRVRFSTTAGIGLVVSGKRACLDWCNFQSCNSHGLHITGDGFHFLDHIMCYANGGDGVKLDVFAGECCIGTIRSQSNTGWGVNDANNNVQIAAGRISNNTAGNLNSTTTYKGVALRTS